MNLENIEQANNLRNALGKMGQLKTNDDLSKIFWPLLSQRLAVIAPSLNIQTLPDIIVNDKKLSSKNSSFFMLIEGSQIDWGGHANDLDYIVSEFKEFDKTIQSVLDFAEKDGNTLVIVTADHETGGLALTGGNLNQSKVKGKFNTGGHSATMVPVFSYGPDSKLFSGIYENTAIFDKMLKAIQQ